LPREWVRLFDNALSPWFGFFVCIQSLLLVHFLRRKKGFLNYKWQLPSKNQTVSEEDVVRPNFISTSRKYNIAKNGIDEHYSTSKRFLKQLASTGFWLVSSAVVILLIFGQHSYYIHLKATHDVEGNYSEGNSAIVSIVGALSGLLFRLLTWSVFAKLNAWENYKTNRNFERAILTKKISFELVNIFGHLVYVYYISLNTYK
jgi:hypothetical protein